MNPPEADASMRAARRRARWLPGGGVPLTRGMIACDATRFAITIAGVGMAVVLMLFLVALYNGVRTESNGWVASRPVDAWVAQMNTTNFIKASSFVPASLVDSLREEPGVAEVTPLLRVITLFESGPRHATAVVIGLDPGSAAGRPDVIAGTSRPETGGMILDGALAHRLGVHLGDSLDLEGHRFHVTGISRGTNSVLTQFAFVTIDEARELLPIRGIASYFLIRAAPGVRAEELIGRLRARSPHVAVLPQAIFAENNMEELRGGLVPILATVAVLGGIVAVAVLTLLLYGSVLERREDYALLKALGASSGVVARVVLAQAMTAVCGGLIVGTLVYAIVAALAARLVPAVPLSLAVEAAALVAAGAFVTGALGALVPLRRIARIHPAEVFRA
jgi:putative ABC transport system permease protein